MKKILTYSILVLAIFSLFQDTNAISYNGSSIRSYPLSYSSGEFLYKPSPWSGDVDNEGCMGSYLPYYAPFIFCSNDSSTRKRATFGYFTEIDVDALTDSSYLPIENVFSPGNFGSKVFLNKNSSGAYDINLKIYDSSSTLLVDGNLGYISSGSSFGSGSLPKRFVLYLSSELSEIQVSSNDWRYYLREVNFCLYVNEVASNVCFTKSYLSSSFPDGLLMGIYTTDQNIYSLQYSYISGRLFDTFYVPPVGQATSPGRKEKWVDFVTGTGAGTMTTWLGGVSAYYVVGGITNTGSTGGGTTGGSTSTGTSSIVDFLYSANSFVSFALSIVKLPQDIYGVISSGLENPNNWCQDPGRLPYTNFSSRIVSSFKAVFDLANPFIPSEGSTLCHWDYGQLDKTFTVHYPRTSNNIVDYFIIVISLLGFFYTSSGSLSHVVTRFNAFNTSRSIARDVSNNRLSRTATKNRNISLHNSQRRLANNGFEPIKPSKEQTSLPLK